MQDQTTKSSLLPKVYCSLFGHNYEISKNVTNHVKEYTCCQCKKQLTTDSNGCLVELTPKFREINTTLEKIYQTKISRLKIKNIVSSIC